MSDKKTIGRDMLKIDAMLVNSGLLKPCMLTPATERHVRVSGKVDAAAPAAPIYVRAFSGCEYGEPVLESKYFKVRPIYCFPGGERTLLGYERVPR